MVAEDVFARKGFRGATMKEIADGVNIKTPALYYHFRNKEDIYNSLIIDRYRQLRAAVVEKVKKESNVKDRISKLILTLIDFWVEHPRLPSILAQQVIWDADPTVNEIMPNFLIPMFNELVDLLDESELEEYGFRDLDITLLVFNIFGMTIFYFFTSPILTVLTGQESMAPDKVDGLKKEILKLVYEGIERQ